MEKSEWIVVVFKFLQRTLFSYCLLLCTLSQLQLILIEGIWSTINVMDKNAQLLAIR